MKQLYSIEYFKYSPFILLLFSIFSWYFIPIIPMASGYGWDGVFYGKVGMNFQDMIGHIDSYHAGRIFPGVFLHYFLVMLKLPLTLSTVLTAYRIYYIVILFSSGLIWVKICKILALNQINSWVGFIALFISYPVLNFYFYYSPLTDPTTLFIAIILIHCYLKPNNFVLLIMAFLSFFSWPTGVIMCVTIFLYGKVKNNFWGLSTVKKSRFFLVIALLLPVIIAVLILPNLGSIGHFLTIYGGENEIFNKIKKNYPSNQYNFGVIVNCLLIIAYYIIIYWTLLKDFDIIGFIKLNFKKSIFVKIVISVAVIFLLSLLKKQIIDYSLPTVTPIAGYIQPVLTMSSRFPLQFITSHIAYWGPAILLLIFYHKRVLVFLKTGNLPISIGIFFAVLLSVNAESRSITNFYPFLVLMLLQIVDFSKVKNLKWFMAYFITLSVICSKIWFPTSLPATIFPHTIYDGLDQFPMQGYFMNFGLWMNYEMYILHTFLAVVFGSIMYFLFIKEPKKN